MTSIPPKSPSKTSDNDDKNSSIGNEPKREYIRGRRIMIIDDHRNIRVSLRLTLESEGATVTEADTVKSALEKLGNLTPGAKDFSYQVVLLDIRLPDGSGLSILKALSEVGLASRVIMISGEGTVSDAFQATQMGAFDYIEKPFAPERILVSVARCLEFNKLQSDNQDLTRKVRKSQELIGDHPRIREVMAMVRRVAPTGGRVLIIGESGTGKELIARAIHNESTRASKPLIKVNCAAIPAQLIESELFGHEKGAFTGATRTRLGVFERADSGTLFLDEIGELNLELQSKLLRVLQSGELNRVGGEKTILVDVRLVAATNRDLTEMVQTGEFREDLYYRLNVVTINMPPLRERASDIPVLASEFLRDACLEHTLGQKQLGEIAMSQLLAYRWPGNIRELKNIIERVAILSEDGVIDHIDELGLAGAPAHFASTSAPPQNLQNPPNTTQNQNGDHAEKSSRQIEATNFSTSHPNTLPNLDAKPNFSWSTPLVAWDLFHEDIGRAYVKLVLRHAKGNVSEAARILCLERAYLHRLMKKLGIQRDIVVHD